MLAMRCNERRWWFPLLRTPLVLGMKWLAFCNGIDAYKYSVKNPACKGCLRFIKTELELKSPTFNLLNRFIGPWFMGIRGNIVTKDDMEDAKRFAQEAM
jgi:hypothetical protein